MNNNSFLKKIPLTLMSVIILTGIFIKYQHIDFNENNIFESFVYADDFPDIQNPETTDLKLNDVLAKADSMKVDQEKVRKIRTFLKQRGAPLASEAEYFVKTADDFGIDYRLVAAVSIIESSGGKYCYRPYNAWGWGGQGNAFVWSNWREGIYIVSRGLGRYYVGGARTPEQIGRRYNPESWQEWARKVRLVMNQIEAI